jgi:hypothetical protein
MPKKRDKDVIYDGIDFGLAKSDPFIPGSYITFRREWAQEVGKATNVWSVYEGVTYRGAVLGQVKWFARWRKYSFFPEGGMVFEQTCLREIAYLCEAATDWHKNWKKQKAATATA